MSRLPCSSEEQTLKNMDNLSQHVSNIQHFDVTDQVMKRLHGKSHKRFTYAAPRRLRPGLAAPALIAFAVVGTAATGYAATQYLDLHIRKGNLVLSTEVVPAKTDDTKQQAKNEGDYYQEAKSRLQPGEYAAYYVKVKNEAIATRQINFVYQEAQLPSFDRLLDEAKRTGAPMFDAPTRLPNGYRFDFGYVTPVTGMMERSEYESLTDELIRQSETAQDGELVMKKLSWNQSKFSFARYAKGEDFINIEASRYDPGTTSISVMRNDQDATEKLTINGIEAYYIHADGGSGSLKAGKNRLGWLDEQRGLHFWLSDNQDSPLTKEDLIRIAEDLTAPRP